MANAHADADVAAAAKLRAYVAACVFGALCAESNGNCTIHTNTIFRIDLKRAQALVRVNVLVSAGVRFNIFLCNYN